METVSLISQALAALLAALVAGLAPILVTRFLGYLHIRTTAAQNALIASAAQRAAGVTYEILVSAGAQGGWSNPAARQAALMKGAEYLKNALPDTLAQCGIIDNNKIETLVAAHLGEMLSRDPTIGVASIASSTSGPRPPGPAAPGASVTVQYPLADAASKPPAWVTELREGLRGTAQPQGPSGQAPLAPACSPWPPAPKSGA
jgi:hypothetical protein